MSGTTDKPNDRDNGTTQKPGPNDISIAFGSTALAGWQDATITLGIEQCPNSFSIGLTEAFPGQAQDVSIVPGTPCRVMIGQDTIITGFIDRYSAAIDKGQHSIRITGRGACENIVDCSAVIVGMQKTGASLVALATELVAPFGVKVLSPDGDGTAMFVIAVNLGETPYEIIERVARFQGFLVYEDSLGNLVLARAGTNKHASGFQQGRNIEKAAVSFSVDQRFSHYIPALFSTDSLSDVRQASGVQGSGLSAGATAVDDAMAALIGLDGKPRYRPHIIISEQPIGGQNLAEVRAAWERNRRRGRSNVFRVTCDSWRDSAGRLWTPNWLAPIDVPACHLTNATWVIASVTFSRNQQTGTTAQLELMAAEAFTPDPTPPSLFDAQLYRAAHPVNAPEQGPNVDGQLGHA